MNGPTHRAIAGGATCLFLMHQEQKNGVKTALPIAGGLAASVLTNLPDLLEPASHPNHRQFFHSVAFAALLGLGFAKLKDWEPEDTSGEILRALGLIGIAGYLIHLALDATTAKSLPLLGKI